MNFLSKVKKKKKRANGRNILPGIFSTFLLAITATVFIFIIIISNVMNSSFKRVRASIDKFIVCQQSTDTIKMRSNDLTELARLFVVNQDERFALAYIEEIETNRSQTKALEDLRQVCSDKDVALQRLEIAISQAESLISMELYDIRLGYEIIGKNEFEIPEILRKIELKSSDKALSKEKLQEEALKNIFGNGYLIYRMRVNENCLITVKAISDEIKKELDENSEKLGKNIDYLRILIFALLIINALSTIGLREFSSVQKSYSKIYEIGEKRTRVLLKRAENDALTGILNRRAYDQICKSSAEQKMSIALLLIDMDNFKSINDTFGHTGGDTALKALASILKDTFRNGDYVARIGGDEFAAILTDFKPEGFKVVTEKINYVNERLSQIKGIEGASVSVGMAYSPSGYSEDLYKKADKALYAVKEAGKKGSRIYEESLS